MFHILKKIRQLAGPIKDVDVNIQKSSPKHGNVP